MINLGNIRAIHGDKVEPVDLIIGGSPCQNLSVAGNRKGLDGEQSCLFLEQIRIIREMRARCNKPDFMIWENVPGALSTNGGSDFERVLFECIKIGNGDKTPDLPKVARWPMAGVIDWSSGSLAWRVHDAQFWGVPQRRRRIALVCDFRGQSAGKILFESKSVPRDSDTGNPQGESAADAAFGSIGESNQCWDARGNGNGQLCATITGDHESRITDYTNVVLSVNADAHESGLGALVECAHTCKTTTREAVCIGNGQAHTACTTELAQTLNCMHDPMTILEPEPIIFDRAAFNQGVNAKFDFVASPGETAPTMTAQGPGAVARPGAYKVRRLTPLECERLQGYPDGWTNIPGASDAKRYKALGNSIALPFWQHLLNRIIPYCESKTMASLFDGIGGFPLCWQRAGGKTLWISEIDKFCDAVTRARFHDKAALKGLNMPTFTIDTDKIKDLDSIHAAINDVAACLNRDSLQIINDEFTEIANLSPIKPTSWTLRRLNELLDKANLLLFDNKTKPD